MTDKKILVTGAAGFIGSHVCDYLLEKEKSAYVIGVDNFITGKKENIHHLFDNDRFEFIEHDIIQPLELNGISQIYNLASPASPIQYQKFSIETMLVNSVGAKNMLDLAVSNKAVFLQASTSEVYGDPLEHPQKESYWGNVNCFGPRSCYDESKRFAEALCYEYAQKKNLRLRVARIFNTYGPRMDKNDGRVVPTFIDQALQNKPITVFGSGSHTRSFCYVSDMVDGLYLLMNSNYTKPVNLGNPQETNMLDLANLIKDLTHSNSKIVFTELPDDDPEKRLPDISIAKKELHWKPEVELSAGLRKTLNCFNSNP